MTTTGQTPFNDEVTQPSFDADAFMQSNVDAPMATEMVLIPEGRYQAHISDFDSSAFELFQFKYKKGPNAGQNGSMLKFTVPFVINDDAAKLKIGKQLSNTLTSTCQMIIDRDEFGKIDYGTNRNVQLGKLRAAVNQNAAGPWAPSSLRNAGPLYVKVVHESYKRADGSIGKAARITDFAKIT